MASITLKARTTGVEKAVRRFATAGAEIDHQLRDAEAEMGKVAEVVFGAYVPVKSGRALRGITSTAIGSKVQVTDEAQNPATGYDYVGVTRYGHGVIVPKHDRAAASVIATGHKRGRPSRKVVKGALRFTVGGRVVYATRVRAWKPPSDWATDALPEVEREARGVATRLGRTIETAF